MKRRLAPLALVPLALAAVALQADEAVDQAVIAQLKIEGFQNSAVMETVAWLTDVHGSRLTGSPSLRAASEWSRDRLAGWGLQNARLEPWGTFGAGWSVERHSVEMTEPQYMRVIAHPWAWSPPIRGVLRGTPVFVEIRSLQDADQHRGRLKGAIVMNGRPGPYDIGFAPAAVRLTEEELARQAEQIHPAAPDFGPYVPRSFWDEDREWREVLARRQEINEFFRTEGVAALLEPSGRDHGAVRVTGFYEEHRRGGFPAFVVAREHYGRIMRLLERQLPVTLELALETRFHTEDTQGYNVIAEIPGADPVLGGEIVMLGAHLDSWHAGTGATDNAAGSAVVMEAARILAAAGVRPRRTIRLALWTGEEQGYLGSIAYVQQHFGDVWTLDVKPEHARVSVYYNLDGGSGRIRGVNLQGNEAVRPIFAAWLEPFHYVGATTLTTLNTGGTDHMPFDALGLPAFQFIQDPLAYDTRTHHTNLDLYEALVEEDLKQAAVIIASFVYHSAMRDERLPRKPLPTPPPARTESMNPASAR